jgi:osmotically-inducible protein OsmY
MTMMTRMMRFLGVAVLTISVLAGCQAMTGKTAGQTVDDAGITTAVKAKLAGEKAATLTRIDVDTNQGVVALNGVVDTSATKQRAEELARQVNGVRSVVNNLQVQARTGS